MNKNLIAKAPISINAPSDKVWNALVKPESIKQYMFGTNLSPTDGKEVRLFGKVRGRQAGKLSHRHDRVASRRKSNSSVLAQDNNATEEARAHSEKNRGMMLTDLKKFLEQ